MKKISKTALNRNDANMEARKRAKEERKREQQLAGIFLKPISKRSKTLLEKIVANKEAYPVYVTVSDEEDTITIRDDCPMALQFVLLVKEFSYGKEYYPIRRTYFNYDGSVCRDIEFISAGSSFMMGSKQQKHSTSDCYFMLEHINRLKNHKIASSEAK